MPRRYYKKTWNYYLHIHCTWRNMHRKTWKNIKLKCISIGFQTTYEFGNEQVCKTKKSNLISIHWKDVYNFNCHTVNPAQLCSGNCRHETRLCAYGPAWPIKAMRCDYLKKHHTLTWHTHTHKYINYPNRGSRRKRTAERLTSPQNGASESQTALSASYLLPVYTHKRIMSGCFFFKPCFLLKI